MAMPFVQESLYAAPQPGERRTDEILLKTEHRRVMHQALRKCYQTIKVVAVVWIISRVILVNYVACLW